MTKCILREDNWCENHQMFHNGRLKELSQMENELGEKYRNLWSKIKDSPENFKAPPAHTKCHTIEIKISHITTYQKIKSFIKAWINHVKNRFKNNEVKEQKRRLDICKHCLYRSPPGNVPIEQWKCTECGCWLKTKAKWAEQNCPKGYWDQTNKPSGGGCGCGH